MKSAQEALRASQANHFNLLLDAVVAGVFLGMVGLIAALSAREWILLLARRKLEPLRETPPVWLPDYALAARPLRLFSLLSLGFLLLKELSGERAMEQARQTGQGGDRREACRQVMEKNTRGSTGVVKVIHGRINLFLLSIL